MAPPEGAREDGEHPAAAWMEKLLTNHAPSRPLHEHRWFCEIVRVLRGLAGPPRPQCEEVQKSTVQGNGFMPSMTNKAPRQLSPVLAVWPQVSRTTSAGFLSSRMALKSGSRLPIREAILLASEGKASLDIALRDDEESMRAALPETTITKTGVQQINVGEVKVGPISIARLVLSDLHVESSTGVARLRNVVTTITLQLSLDWKVGVTIDTPLGDVDFSRSGSVNLGLLEFSLGLGNITLPGFANLSFDIASLPVTNVAAVVGPIQNLNLGPAIAEQIRATNIGVPTAGFQLAGLQLSKLRVEGLKIPAADLGQATIDYIQGGALPLTNLKIPNLELPQARIPDLKSSNIDASSNPATKGLHADLGILEITLSVTTTARFQIDELRVENIKAASRIGAIELTDVVLPYEVFDLTLSQIGIETIEIPQLEVS